jgi:antitoxin component YwqK of YwqJK toxin-antitoxin module
MKKLLILLFSILLSFNSYGGLFDKTVCVETETVERGGIIYLPNKTKPFTGKNLCEYVSGQYKSKGNVKKGVKDGKWTYWFENGEIKPESEYKDGVKIVPPICLDGLASLPNNMDWDISGDFLTLENDNNPFSGTTICRSLSDDEYYGWFDMKLTWELGIPVFHREEAYYPNGNQMWVWNRTFGEFISVGKQTVWYENGQIKSEQHYKDGKVDGRVAEWSENGQLLGEAFFKDDECISEDCY